MAERRATISDPQAATDEEFPEDESLVGVRLGNYVLEEIIGRGGMGTVYRAEHVYIHKPAAVKVLHRRYFDNPDARHRFLHEAQTASVIDHPNIIGVNDFGEAPDGTVFLVITTAFGVVHSWWALLTPLGVGLVGMMFSVIGLSFTAVIPLIDFFTYYWTMFITPMFLFSGIFFPLDRLPRAVQDVVRRWRLPARVLVEGNVDDVPPRVLSVAYMVIREALA